MYGREPTRTVGIDNTVLKLCCWHTLLNFGGTDFLVVESKTLKETQCPDILSTQATRISEFCRGFVGTKNYANHISVVCSQDEYPP